MSIMRMLTRLCAVAALRDHTWADRRVFDSDNTPLSQALALNDPAKPYIVVYTDSDNRNQISGTDLHSGTRELNLSLEIGVASKIVGKTNDVELQIPLTDAGLEIALDMVENQAMAAMFGNPQSDWAELLKEFVLRVTRVSGQRGASADRDRRWAARQTAVICDVIADQAFGEPVPEEHPLRKFISVSDAHPESEMGPMAEICAALAAQEAAPEWEQIQAMLGVRRQGLRAIGLAPLSENFTVMASSYGDDLTDKRGEAPILREIAHDDIQMERDESVGLVDEFAISTNVVTAKPTEKKDKVVIIGKETGKG